jgi:hypothetical protein
LEEAFSKRSFSKTLDTMGKGFIGQKVVNSLGGFLGFKMRMVCKAFRCAEKYRLSKTASNNWVRNFIPIRGNPLRILPVMRSKPDDFFGFRLLMTS